MKPFKPNIYIHYDRCSMLRIRWLFHKQPCRWFGQPAAQTHPHLLQNGEVTPGITKVEYNKRRINLMEKFVAKHPNCHHIAIIPSASKVYMTHDIPYVFRQNTDFLYLSGFLEPDSVLVLESDRVSNYKSTLFVPKKDAHKELWEGPRSGPEGAIELTGVSHAENIDNFTTYLTNKKLTNQTVVWYNMSKPTHLVFHLKFIVEFLKQRGSAIIENPTSSLHALRSFKSPAEVAIMEQSNRVASDSFVETMKFSYPGVNEAHLFAKMEFECKLRGADYLAYPPVVAGGARANTIHYIENKQVVDDGQMVLMDAGCELHGYASDITRTWPVSGEFTTPQRMLYECVLDAQLTCVKMCKHKDITLNKIYTQMLTRLGSNLNELGILKGKPTGQQLQKVCKELCPHHVGHYLGMDIHDTDEVSRSVALKPGMCVTIEPGLYIPQNRTDVHTEFRGQGIRIEDNILITDSGYTNLTKHCPKDPDTIQNIVKSGVKNMA